MHHKKPENPPSKYAAREVCSKTKGRMYGGFTLIELLVVVGIVSVLGGVMLPALNSARAKARLIKGVSNQRQIVTAVNLFAADNRNRYPESVATIGMGNHWNWQDPRMMTGYMRRSTGLHRSMSAYLHDYLDDADVMFCPGGPEKYKYLQEMWDAGDDWDNPDTPPIPDPVIGSYCFYWNYVGYLGEDCAPFKGPWGPSRSRRSKLLVSDYFGYDNFRSPEAIGSCEDFKGAEVTAGTCASSSYWSLRTSDPESTLQTIEITLYAGYVDGHVENFEAADVIGMQVSIEPDGSTPYQSGPGVFFLPGNSWR